MTNSGWSTFTALCALHAARFSHEEAVCPFVKCVICHKMEERSVQIFIPYERPFSLVFWEEECLVGWPLLPEILGSSWPHWSEIADFHSVFAHNASAITPGKKVQLTLIGSPLCTFQWAKDEQRVAQKHKVSKIWTISCDNSETEEIGCQLVV